VKRGDLITVALQGDYGKPRSALIVQTDLFAPSDSVTILMLSSTLVAAPLLRITVEPSPRNGLRQTSQVMVDKVMTVRRERVGEVIGQLEDGAMITVTRSLALFLGLA